MHGISQTQQTAFLQSKQALQAVQSDISSGNTSQAQTDFATFQQDALGFFSNATTQPPASTSQPAASPQTDLQTLQSDLSSGNITGAQQALAAFQQATQSLSQQWGRGHHHHWSDGNNQGSATPTTSSSASTSTTGTGTTAAPTPASNIAALQSLLSAYQSLSGNVQALNAGSILNLVG